MKNTKGVSTKVLILLLTLVLLIGCAAGGTLAWLMTKTDPVVNTFTVGNVAITLKEHVLNPTTGQWQTPETLTDVGNQGIQVLPGRTIQKDPTLTVLKGSEECYVRVLIKISWSEEADAAYGQAAQPVDDSRDLHGPLPAVGAVSVDHSYRRLRDHFPAGDLRPAAWLRSGNRTAQADH